MSVRFTKIECVEKTGTLVTTIYGTIAPQSSDELPRKGMFKAIEQASGPAWYKEELIQFLTLNNTKCFYIPDPDQPQKNLLDRFPECKK